MNNLCNIKRFLIFALIFFCAICIAEGKKGQDILETDAVDTMFILPIEYTSDPGSNGLSGPEVLKRNETFGNVTRALMKVYLPVSEEPTSCVIIFPGGGYDNVCVGNAGTQGARFFIEHGIAVAVVKYRLPNGHIDVPILDGQQAIKMVRKNAGKWNIKPDRIGICGSSAGGHLASMLAVHTSDADISSPAVLDHYSSRPDFVILLKAAINWSKGNTMRNSHGPNPTDETIFYCNALNHIEADHAPTFIAHCYDDPAAPCTGTVNYFLKLRNLNVPAEIHVYDEGRHGLGFWDRNRPMDEWMDALLEWRYLY